MHLSLKCWGITGSLRRFTAKVNGRVRRSGNLFVSTWLCSRQQRTTQRLSKFCLNYCLQSNLPLTPLIGAQPRLQTVPLWLFKPLPAWQWKTPKAKVATRNANRAILKKNFCYFSNIDKLLERDKWYRFPHNTNAPTNLQEVLYVSINRIQFQSFCREFRF